MTTLVEYRPGLFSRIVKFLGPRSLITWILTLTLLVTVATSMTSNINGIQGNFVVPVVLFALTLGWLVSQLNLRTFPTVLIGLLIGSEYLLIRVGRLQDRLWDIVRVVFTFLRQLFTWYWTEIPPEWGSIPYYYGVLFKDMGTLLSRAGYWLRDVALGIGALDPVGSTITWGFGFWICSYWAGWMGRKHHNPLLGLMPLGIMMGYVLSYTGANPYNLLPILGLTLVLMALMKHYAREDKWSKRGIDFSRGLWGDVTVISTAITVLLVIIAAIVPSISFDKISDWYREITESDSNRTEVVADSLGLEAKPEPRAPTPLEMVAQTGLPRQHLIGSGPELSRLVVMVVKTADLPTLMQGEFDQAFYEANIEIPRYYWRSITYDRYFGRGWMTTNTEEEQYFAGDELTWPPTEYVRQLRQEVKVVGDNLGGLVYVTGNLVTMDEDFTVAMRYPDEVFAVTSEAKEFRADSLVPVVTEERLRETLTNYPEWIADRYLQLPENIPERVLELARDLTATEPTPYDRALAIEQYLRTFEYTLDVPKPGTRDDIADYFLFELQKGYCDYYATSMVVLARAAGLPARLVVGYVSGTFDFANARFIVTEADAHAWVEVYFPEVGWIEFEPTGGRPPLERESAEEEYIWPDNFELEPLVDPNQLQISRIVLWQWLLLVGGGSFAVVFILTAGDSLFLFFRKTSPWMVSRLYHRFRQQARNIEAFVHDGDTPNEVLQAFSHRIHTIVLDRDRYREYIEDSVFLAQSIVDAYIKLWYSPRADMQQAERWDLAWVWWDLRWRIWLAWLFRRPRKTRPPMPTSVPTDRYVQQPPQTL